MWKHARHNRIELSGDRQSAFIMARGRLSILSVSFIAAYLLVLIRLADLSIVQGTIPQMQANHDVQQEQQVAAIAPRRGDIYDRNGFLIATTLKTPSVFVDPALVKDQGQLLFSLSSVLPDLDKEKTARILGADNRFGWIARQITPAQQRQILEIGDPALGFQYEYTRIYPQGALFAHMVGYMQRDGLGLAGMERGFDDILSAGKDINVTLDLRLQHVVKREVSKAMADFNAIGGAGIILDAKSGEVIAAVSLPDFDLNDTSKAKENQKFNRLTLGVYELGSMFKIFSTAGLLELENAKMQDEFDARNPLKIGWHTINDYHAQKRILNIPEVFVHSSNIGSALMGQKIGGKALHAFYDDLGLLNEMKIDIKEVGRPIVPPPNWSESTTMTVSYGHGLATTPLQMSAAVGTIVNGGIGITPYFLMKDQGAIQSQIQVISEKTSADMRKLMRLAVTKGTGKNADVSGLEVGGKTGTAEKSVNGRYDRKKLISSFVGAFPMSDPRYVVMVMVDEPKGNAKSFGYATAGWVAAPAAKRIVTSMASILGMATDKYNPAQDIGRDLEPYIRDPKETPSGRRHLASVQ